MPSDFYPDFVWGVQAVEVSECLVRAKPEGALCSVAAKCSAGEETGMSVD